MSLVNIGSWQIPFLRSWHKFQLIGTAKSFGLPLWFYEFLQCRQSGYGYEIGSTCTCISMLYINNNGSTWPNKQSHNLYINHWKIVSMFEWTEMCHILYHSWIGETMIMCWVRHGVALVKFWEGHLTAVDVSLTIWTSSFLYWSHKSHQTTDVDSRYSLNSKRSNDDIIWNFGSNVNWIIDYLKSILKHLIQILNFNIILYLPKS